MIPAIIPARGGSKGIKHKNIVQVHGKPLVAWSIEHAKNSRHISEVIVATDCLEIAAVARQFGADVFWRSAESATDEAPSETVLLEVVGKRYVNAEYVCFLQSTSPCRQQQDLDHAIEAMRKHEADSMFSCRIVEGYTWRLGKDFLLPNYQSRHRRQDKDSVWLEENGSFYVFRPNVLLEKRNRLGGRILPFLMDPMDSFQIDSPEDIPVVERAMEVRCDYLAAAAH